MTEMSHRLYSKAITIRYDNGDHHLLEQEVDLDHRLDSTRRTLTIFCDFVLRDSSGTFDDPYEGWVNFVAIADLV